MPHSAAQGRGGAGGEGVKEALVMVAAFAIPAVAWVAWRSHALLPEASWQQDKPLSQHRKMCVDRGIHIWKIARN